MAVSDKLAARPVEFPSPKLAEIVAGRLRSQIARAELKEGDFLPPEKALLGQLRVSRAVLREALRILETESLIRVRRGTRNGAEVCAPRADVTARHFGLILQLQGATLGDLFRARIALEPVAVRMLAERNSRARIRELEKLLEEESHHLADPRAFGRLALRFYEEVVRQCGNPILVLIGTVLTALVEGQAKLALRENVNRYHGARVAFRRPMKTVLEAHAQLLRLVKGHQAREAEAFWRKHLEKIRRYFPRDADRTPISILGS